jgi:hypothetical protein
LEKINQPHRSLVERHSGFSWVCFRESARLFLNS